MRRTYRLTCLAFAAMAGALVGSGVRAEDATTDLPKLAIAAKEQFAPITSERVAAAKRDLTAKLEVLRQKLSRNPAAVRDGWHEFLMTTDLQAQMAEAQPDSDALQKVLTRYLSDKKGMEWAPVLATRAELRNYLTTLTLSRDEKTAETYGTTLDDLAAKLSTYATAPTPADAQSIGRSLGWLRRAHQVPDLVTAIDQAYSRPNLLVHASRTFMAAGIEQDVDDTTQIQDSVLGAAIHGTVHTKAHGALQLQDDSRRASFQILLTGNAYSNNVGYKGPVAVYTTGVTSISANKTIWLDDQGLHAGPASARCATSTSINDIHANCNLIRKLAWRQASKSQARAEAIASAKAEQRVEERVDQQASEMLAKSNESFVERFRNPLLRRGGLPRNMRFSTTSESLRAVLSQAGDANVAAPTEAPEIGGNPDLAVRLHQSFIGNFSEAYVGGITLTDERLVEMLEEAKREVPEELKIGPDKDPWSITFAAEQPISATFHEEGISISIHGRRFTRGDQEIRSPMRITGTYTIEKTPEGTRLVRKGDVEAEYVGIKGRESVGQVAFKTFVRRKFEAMFKTPIQVDVEKLPERWEQAGKLTSSEFEAKSGWLSLGWKLAPRAAAQTAQLPSPR